MYRRFMVLGDARTGSNMLVQALNSNPEIRCFREIFNWPHDFIDFEMEGYDPHDPSDMALRAADPMRFLHERIFGEHPSPVRAVGFKFLYPHFWGYEGLIEAIGAERDIDVIHIKRRNLLRSLVSTKIAEQTGRWTDDKRFHLAGRLRWENVPKAARHPGKAARALWQSMRRESAPAAEASGAMTLSYEECGGFFYKSEWDACHFERLMEGHKLTTVYYEDIVDDWDATLDGVQRFLGVEPHRLTVTLRRQNPQPLSELIANYDELRRAFADTPYASFFE